MNTFSSLVKDIVTYSDRNDLDLLAPKFIELAELAMYQNDVAPLMVREMANTSKTVPVADRFGLPQYYERMRSLKIKTASGYRSLVYKTPNTLTKYENNRAPLFYTVVGDEVELDATPDDDFEVQIQYFRKAPALSKTNQTNTILENHFNIYLFGALAEAFDYAQDAEQEQKYRSKFYSAIRGANKADKKGRYGTAPAITLPGVTP